MTMMTGSLARKGAMILGAALALTALTDSANAYWRGGCWGCGAFAAGAIAGADGDRRTATALEGEEPLDPGERAERGLDRGGAP